MMSARCSRSASAAADLFAINRCVLAPSPLSAEWRSRKSRTSASTAAASARATAASRSQPSSAALAFSAAARAFSAASVRRASSASFFAMSASARRFGPATSRERSKLSCSESFARCCVNLARSSAERCSVARLCASYSRMFSTPTDWEKEAYTSSSTACTLASTASTAARDAAHARSAASSAGSVSFRARSMLAASLSNFCTFSEAILMSTA